MLSRPQVVTEVYPAEFVVSAAEPEREIKADPGQRKQAISVIPEEETEGEPVYFTGKPAADYIVTTLIKAGYTEPVVAGILGNIMAECGSYTMELNPTALANGFYGICQWSSYYYPAVQGADLQTQVQFLLDTIKYEFDVFGNAFGTSYEEFTGLSDPSQAALQFAQVYERCASFSYSTRQEYACIALDTYFE